jgi:ribosome biogenesis protein YTM1
MAYLTLFRLTSQPSTSTSSTLATLVLHTSPLSSVSASSNGTHLLTASWDGLVGVWSTSIPSENALDRQDGHSESERKKRRKTQQVVTSTDSFSSGTSPIRKTPVAVLKSHIGRVSKAVFGDGDMNNVAYSCGFDSTARTWDVENGLCTHTLVRDTCTNGGVKLTITLVGI